MSIDLVPRRRAQEMRASTLGSDVARDEKSAKVVMKTEKVGPCCDGAGRECLWQIDFISQRCKSQSSKCETASLSATDSKTRNESETARSANIDRLASEGVQGHDNANRSSRRLRRKSRNKPNSFVYVYMLDDSRPTGRFLSQAVFVQTFSCWLDVPRGNLPAPLDLLP